MSLARLLVYCGLFLFGIIFVLALFKGEEGQKEASARSSVVSPLVVSPPLVTGPQTKQPEVKLAETAQPQKRQPVEVPLDKESIKPLSAAAVKEGPKQQLSPAQISPSQISPHNTSTPERAPPSQLASDKGLPEKGLPEGDIVERLFDKKGSGLKFIETITYKSRVPWQKGRPAWLSDYASHHETSRHFIARSLNGSGKGVVDYLKQEVGEGDRFNVFKNDVKLRFHLVVDASLCKMWLYALDETHHEKTLLKTYTVCLGRPDSSKTSGLLTPLGRYQLGSRIAIYKPKVMGYHNGKKVEMVRVFGSRWIPFEKEIGPATAPAKGFGLHGVPWVEGAKGELSQDKSSLGKYESDGCIRLSTEDMEEIFAIIITKPTEIEIVRSFKEASINK